MHAVIVRGPVARRKGGTRVDRLWREFLEKIQEENDLFLDEIEHLLEKRDRELEALRLRVAELEDRVARLEQIAQRAGKAKEELPQADGMPSSPPSDSSRAPFSLEDLAKQAGRGVGEVQLILALAERRKKGRGKQGGAG